MAHIQRPLTRFREYRSIETATAFLNDFWINVEDNMSGTEDDPEDADSDAATDGEEHSADDFSDVDEEAEEEEDD